jgi:protein SCO1/2
VLLTIAIDPALDRGDALAEYARVWTTDARAWHFLTGPLEEVKRVAGMFGVQFWQDEGSLTHSFHTAVIDRRGMLAGNLDGDEFIAQQLGDLVQRFLTASDSWLVPRTINRKLRLGRARVCVGPER